MTERDNVMDLFTLSHGLAMALGPLLTRGSDDPGDVGPVEAPDRALHSVWLRIRAEAESNPTLKESIADIRSWPQDPDALGGFRMQLKKLLSSNAEIKKAAEEIAAQARESFKERAFLGVPEPVGKYDTSLQRLEIVYQLRAGRSSKAIAEEFRTTEENVFRLNSAFSSAGVAGLISEAGIETWIDRLDPRDPILRRIEMIRLLRSGTPSHVIGRQYNAIEDYIERIDERFARNGVLGILTEEDFVRFRSVNPEIIRICSYNLHGMHSDGYPRLKRIAAELATIDPDEIAFQEVVSGTGTEETSSQLAGLISSITGYHYRSQFCYCHQFMQTYPEGIAITSRNPLKNVKTIDLTVGLRDGLEPSMPRNAVAAQVSVYGRLLVFVSVHLDHCADSAVRLAQAEKLAREVELYCEQVKPYCVILAGDFNDVEDSRAMNYLRARGYRDAYRSCHKSNGETFPASDPRMRIDYILVKGNGVVVSSDLLLKNPELSDHVGVFAEVR